MCFLISNLGQIKIFFFFLLCEIKQNTTETSPCVLWFVPKDMGTSAIPSQWKFSAWICHDLFFNLDGLTWEMSKVAAKFREENKIRFIHTNRSLNMSGFYHLCCQTIVYSKMVSVNKGMKRYTLALFSKTVIDWIAML